MQRLLRLRQPALVFAMFPTSLFLGVPAAWIARVPAILCSRRNSGYWRRWFHFPALRVINRMATGWQVNGPAIAEVLAASEGVDKTRVDLLTNWLDLERFRPADAVRRAEARRQLGLSADGFVVLSSANYNAVKDLATLVAAAALVVRERPDAQFLLAGQGPERASLEREIERLGVLEHVRLLGTQHDLEPYLAAADMGVLTSRSEGCSNAVLEYMASGLPTVLSDIPANRALSASGLFRVGDAEALAAELLRLARDPAEARSRARVNLQRMAPYSQGKYEQLVQAHFVTAAAMGRQRWGWPVVNRPTSAPPLVSTGLAAAAEHHD
ncbi:MAG: glycosyltransferase [Terriglobales bacterium]